MIQRALSYQYFLRGSLALQLSVSIYPPLVPACFPLPQRDRLCGLTYGPAPVSVSQHNISEALTLPRQYVQRSHCSSEGRTKCTPAAELLLQKLSYKMFCPFHTFLSLCYGSLWAIQKGIQGFITSVMVIIEIIEEVLKGPIGGSCHLHRMRP